MTKQCVCIVSGKVQGVLFRDFTCRLAKRLLLTGTVENLPDGKVKVIVEGDMVKLGGLLLQLQKGPILAKVKDMKVDWREPSNLFSNFKILYHGFLDHF